MKTDSRIAELSHKERKSWQAPVVEVLMISETRAKGSGVVDGPSSHHS